MKGTPQVTRTGDEVVVTLSGDLDFPSLCATLERMLSADPALREGRALVLDTGRLQLTADQVMAIEGLVRRLAGTRLLHVITEHVDARAPAIPDRDRRPAWWGAVPEPGWTTAGPPAGPAATGRQAPGGAHAAGGAVEAATSPAIPPDRTRPRRKNRREAPSPPAPAGEATADAPAAGPGWGAGSSPGTGRPRPGVVVRRTLRSGHRLVYDGDVVILGDVNPGAEVLAAGDVVVFGRLRGIVHAGCRGEAGAVVASLAMEPIQLRIAHCIGRAPDDQPAVVAGRASLAPGAGPEIAYVRDGRVVIEPFDPARWFWQRQRRTAG
ncbi:MAG TPA: septum site-determining protein MinC [Thermaerobacter sp.]